MRHFEKKGGVRLFKRLTQKGSTVILDVGHAAGGRIRIVQNFRSAAAARKLVEAWAQILLAEGFTEIPLPPYSILGLVTHLESTKGPGRIHTDEGKNVYFSQKSLEASGIRQSDRVILFDVYKNKERRESFMLGSLLETKRVLNVPKLRWNVKEGKKGLSGKQRNRLLKKIGSAVLGHQKRAEKPHGRRCGDLIFAYEKGIHRFLKLGRNGGIRVVFYELVFNSKLQRASSRILMCAPNFCSPVPASNVRELEQFFRHIRPWAHRRSDQ